MSRLILPLPPTLNHAYRNVTADGRRLRVPTAAAKRFQTEAGWMAKQWMGKTGWRQTERTKVILRYWTFWPDNRRRDTGNLEKFLSDSLAGILFDDDRYLLPRAMDYEVDKQCPRVEVELEVMEG